MSRRARFVTLITLALALTLSGQAQATGPSASRDMAALDALASRAHLDDAAIAEARAILDALPTRRLSPREAERALSVAAALIPRLSRERLRAEGGDSHFVVWTPPGGVRGGGNTVLQADVAAIAADAARLRRLAAALRVQAPEVTHPPKLDLLRLLARYRSFIAARWSIGPATASAFEASRRELAGTFAQSADGLRRFAETASWQELASLDPARPPAARHQPARPAPAATNPHLAKVDAAIADPRTRAAIRAVQPASVRVAGASGVNLLPSGLILTNAHVVKTLGRTVTTTFPDGRSVQGRVTAIDDHLDLALVTLSDARGLPFAPLATTPAQVGDPVIIIGQPGTRTPDGAATGYQPFHVSTGHIRKVLPDPLGAQRLGRLGYDAWTYWGHSGSPIFRQDGAVVGLHNTWDSTNGMRHGIPQPALTAFLKRHGIEPGWR